MSLPADSHTVQPGTPCPLLRILVEFEGWGLSNSAIKGDGQTTDLTVTGCRIESSQCVAPGMHLTLRLHLPDHAEPVTVTLARVRSSQDSVFEVEFVHLPDDDQRRLKQVLEAPHEYESLAIPPATLSPQKGPYTILVVDDDPDMLRLCATTLACPAMSAEPADESISRLRLSGFGTFGVTHTESAQAFGFKREVSQPAYDGGTHLDVDSRLGLQANYTINPQFELVGQLL